MTLQALGRHLDAHPATPALRALRDDLVKDGIPLDKLASTPGLGSHDAYQSAASPEARLREYMKWVVSTNQYSSSTAPRFLAAATMQWLRSAAAPDGTLSRDDVVQKLGPRAAAVYDQLVTELRAGDAAAATATATTAPSSSTAWPANMLGAHARPPDRGPLHIAPEVIRRLPIRMMVADLRMVGQLERRLAERSQRRDPARRIATHLGKGGIASPDIPALKHVVDTHKATQPFAGCKVLVLQHLYASTQTILDAAVTLGAKPADVTVMGKPYSGSMRVAASMVEKGFSLVVPSLHQSEFSDHEGHMDALVKEQVTRLLAESTPDQKLLVLDDGGHVAKVVHEHFAALAHRFRFVEQTQRGANTIKELASRVQGGLRAPVVNVAESRAKKDHESPCIAASVWKESKAILDKLAAQGADIPASATILGFGAIGSHTAAELARAGYSVHVYDPDPARQQQAKALGYTVHADKQGALAHANVLVSATGRTALALDDTRHLPKQAVLINAASANNELNATNLLTLQMLSANALMGTVRVGPSGIEVPRSLVSQVDTAQLDEHQHLWDTFAGRSVDLGRDDSATQRDRVVHTKEGQDLYVAHAGFVVNLTDDDDPIPPRYIGLTRSLLLAALVQSAGEDRTGVVDLDDDVQQEIIDQTEQALLATGESLAHPRF